MGMKWYHFRYQGKTVTTKGTMEYQARAEAAERLGCDARDMVCTGHEPFGSQWVPPAEYKRT